MKTPSCGLFLVISACGGGGDVACGEDAPACPAGTYSVAWSDQQPGQDASEANAPILTADVGYLQFEEGACQYACETVALCPGWTWPVITAYCAYCATTDASGEVVRVGGVSGSACDAVPHPGIQRVQLDKTVVVGSRAQGIITAGEFVGLEQFYWEQADGRNLCTVSYDLTSIGSSLCPDCDFSFELELSNGRVSGQGCGALGVDSGIAAGQRIGLGFAEQATIRGRTFDDVLYWQSGAEFVPYYEGHWDADGDRFSYEKVWGAW
jgi:hypothetical protein